MEEKTFDQIVDDLKVEIAKSFDSFMIESSKSNNKAAERRARKESFMVGKLMKKYRKLTNFRATYYDYFENCKGLIVSSFIFDPKIESGLIKGLKIIKDYPLQFAYFCKKELSIALMDEDLINLSDIVLNAAKEIQKTIGEEL